MKRRSFAVFLMLVALLLIGCSSQSTYDVDGVSYTVDREKKSISDGEDTYDVKVGTLDGNEVITVIYPNGVEVRRIDLGEHAWSDNSADADIQGYASFDTLLTVIEEAGISGDRKANIPMILAGVVLAGAGAVCAAKPETIWRITEGWKYESAEPGAFLLKIYATGGMIAVVAGVAIILGGILGAT